MKLIDLPARTVSPLTEAERKLKQPREFTPGEKALIRRVHGYMPAVQLLGVLNERLVCDQGGGAVLHTMEQLRAEIGALPAEALTGASDWSSLRKLVAQARKSGVLERITREVIDDFAVVYSLSAAQVLRLHDVLLTRNDGDQQ